jgi:hypothetical protein
MGGACSAYGGGQRDQWGDPGIDGRIILGWNFGKLDVGVWTGLGWLRIETGGRHCACSNEPLGSVKCREFLDKLQTG